MNIFYTSDLHNEFYRTENNGRGVVPDLPVPAGTDLIILAGDIDVKLHGVHFANKLHEQYKVPVLYVPGNHEYYSGNYPGLTNKIRNNAFDGVFVMDNDVVIIDGVRFIGSTLWTDGKLFPDIDYGKVLDAGLGDLHLGGTSTGQKDFKKIRFDKGASFRKLRPGHLFAACIESKAFIEQQLAEVFDGDTVVITHHAPSIKSIDDADKDQLQNAYYASDLEWLILKYQPVAWIHGHVHQKLDYKIGETRILNNPRGYLKYELTISDKWLTVGNSSPKSVPNA